MKENVTGYVVKCPDCGKAYLPEEDVCNCPEPHEDEHEREAVGSLQSE